MKAVILAGGMGTRLRPLTNIIPKPLIPLVDKPLISHIIDSLPRYIDTVFLAVNYKKDVLEDYFKKTHGRKVILVEEREPLGTGGALKNVSRYLDDTFVACNGDIISSIDVAAMIEEHRQKGGIGMIALWRVNDPSAFGAVSLSEDKRIELFQEKPKPGEACSNLINAGIYVFEPEILDCIGDGFVSLEREVFPKILDRGLYGYSFDGYWVDCGVRENLLEAQRILLSERGEVCLDSRIDAKARIVSPNFITDAEIGSATVGPCVCICGRSVVHDGAKVSCSLLMEGSVVGRGAVVRNSIVGPNVRVGDGEIVENSILV
ncbi:MAG: NDP-sugar synthase [Methanomassiliicoccales archaeon]|jgi:mannose-1-phosphate guanylyltransferase|nr:NDP-sugar synthase [Methanomassiliicoccales archaeon]